MPYFCVDVPSDSNTAGELLRIEWHIPLELCIRTVKSIRNSTGGVFSFLVFIEHQKTKRSCVVLFRFYAFGMGKANFIYGWQLCLLVFYVWSSERILIWLHALISSSPLVSNLWEWVVPCIWIKYVIFSFIFLNLDASISLGRFHFCHTWKSWDS